MIETEIDKRDVLSLNIALRGLEPKNLLKGELWEFADEIIDVVGKYPPDFPGNTYVRTGLLGRNWLDPIMKGPFEVHVVNITAYAKKVHGHEQMALHAGHGWKHLFDVAWDMADDFIKKIAAKVDRIWRK